VISPNLQANLKVVVSRKAAAAQAEQQQQHEQQPCRESPLGNERTKRMAGRHHSPKTPFFNPGQVRSKVVVPRKAAAAERVEHPTKHQEPDEHDEDAKTKETKSGGWLVAGGGGWRQRVAGGG
jgi:hypothetical protein